MSIESDLYAVLSPLVEGRASPDTFPQDVKWPAIRYSFVSVVPGATICGSGGDRESDFRIQIDVVTQKAKGYDAGKARDALRLAIVEAMKTYPIPNVVDSWSKSFDPETQGYRAQIDFFLHPST